MWRIFYQADTGKIRYMISMNGVTGNETLAFIDVQNKIDINDKMIDVETGNIVIAPPPPEIVFPVRSSPGKIIKRSGAQNG